ncbi:MAG: pyridoxamine 5'-phosphate oxidase [Bacteroidales bacterium]|nr:pyridoxamine 5'-phosphate oxidase [Bacteroidales bacterium]
MGIKLAHIRKNYQKSKLSDGDVIGDPFLLFENWYNEAVKNGESEPNAMVLSTVNGNKPSARIVLLKELSEGSFLFFTNYNSRKGNELKLNPFVALTLFWPGLERQVRIEGEVGKLRSDVSENYFNSRPEESRISAIISPQSQVIPSKKFLEDKFTGFISANQPIQRPEHWGGYRCIPESIEFWQGGEHRLHDRIRFTKEIENWKIERLAP